VSDNICYLLHAYILLDYIDIAWHYYTLNTHIKLLKYIVLTTDRNKFHKSNSCNQITG